MKIREVRRHVLSDYRRPQRMEADADARSLRDDRDFRERYYAFTCMLYHPRLEALICGHTNFANDLLHVFDLRTRSFRSLGYAGFAEKYEIKVHRGLELAGDGSVYGATSCLHDVSERLDAPGGKVFRWDPSTGAFSLVSIPCPPDYIQTISLDWNRRMVYGMTYPVFNFFAASLESGEVAYSQYMGSITHIGAVDDDGGYWGTWGDRHRFFRYDPGTNAVSFLRAALDSPCESLMYPGAGPVDSFINGGDGFLYVGSEKCELYRIDPKSGVVTYLAKPFVSNRLPGLVAGEDGLLYGVGGNDNAVRLFTYDRRTGAVSVLGRVADSRDGEPCFRPHDLVKVGGSLFVGETDNPFRSDCLWECLLE